MDNPLESVKSVPIWVWLGLAIVMFIALTTHTASQSATLTPDATGASDTSALQQAQLAAQTAVSLRVLDITGAEDIARIQARTQEQNNNAAIAAIQAQSQGNVDQIIALQPPQPINVTVSRNAASTQAFTRNSAIASAQVRAAKTGVLNSVSGGFLRQRNVAYGHGGL